MSLIKESDIIQQDKLLTMGLQEKLMKNLNFFNHPSLGCFNLMTKNLVNNFTKTRQPILPLNMISRRDLTSSADLAVGTIDFQDHVDVRLHRNINPLEIRLQAAKDFNSVARKASMDGAYRGDYAYVDNQLHLSGIGTAIADRVLDDCIDVAIGSSVAYLKGVSALKAVQTHATKAVQIDSFLQLRKIFGDQGSAIKIAVAHSDVYYAYLAETFASKVGFQTLDLGFGIGVISTQGLAYLFIDHDSLKFNAAGNKQRYYILGMQQNAVNVSIDQIDWANYTDSKKVAGISSGIRGQYDIGVALKGVRYKSTSGANPTKGILETSGNWLKTAAQDRATIGCLLEIGLA